MREWVVGAARIELVEGDITRQGHRRHRQRGEQRAAWWRRRRRRDPSRRRARRSLRRAGSSVAALPAMRRSPPAAASRRSTSSMRSAHLPRRQARRGRARWRARIAAVCEVAAEHRVASLAFPSISTGAYGYPIAAAARIALADRRRHAAASPHQPSALRPVQWRRLGDLSRRALAEVAGGAGRSLTRRHDAGDLPRHSSSCSTM